MSAYAIGVDLGGTSIKAALVERAAGIVRSAEFSTGAERGVEHVLSQLEAAVRSMLANGPGHPIQGVGIGAPGTIDLARTTLIHPPNIPGWGRVNLCEVLGARLNGALRVLLENDANAAALGSAYYGAGQPYRDFIMVTLGTGVGGAIVAGRKLFRGTTGAAGEIGHMSICYDGPKDRAGIAGSIEAYLGQHFLTAHAREQLKSRPGNLLYQLAGNDLSQLTPALLSAAAEQGDEAAKAVLRWAGHKLGCVLGSCVHLLDIRVVIVGGGVSQAGVHLLDPARKSILACTKDGMREGVTIVRETLGNEAGTLGAASLVFESTGAVDS